MTLRTITTRPYNAEASLSRLATDITPVRDFYVRSNFDAPLLSPDDWRLRVHGRVGRELEMDFDALRALPHVTRRLTLECAGNGRRLMDPQPSGTPWELGAAGTATFTGVSLPDVLAQAGVLDDAVECLFTGADGGMVEEGDAVRFQRSLPIDLVAGTDAPLIVWAMNGTPLTRDHGAPVRLVVPNYYAVASVKWLVDIELIARPFTGHFQSARYVYRVPGTATTPVTTMRVRSLITSHEHGAQVAPGELRIEGTAWSGAGRVERVEVAADNGPWLAATLDDARDQGAATLWHVSMELPPGHHVVRARATDSTGDTQPLEPIWNELGYGNNVVHAIELHVSDT